MKITVNLYNKILPEYIGLHIAWNPDPMKYQLPLADHLITITSIPRSTSTNVILNTSIPLPPHTATAH